METDLECRETTLHFTFIAPRWWRWYQLDYFRAGRHIYGVVQHEPLPLGIDAPAAPIAPPPAPPIHREFLA